MHDWRAQLQKDFLAFAERGLPQPLEAYVLETYRLNLASRYGNLPVKNPFGKASGQLSLALHQIEKDAQAGLGFSVLKTVVAQDARGAQSMHAWAIPETRMLVEKIRGVHVDEEGWTVTWKGRGWSESFDAYLKFFEQAVRVGDASDMRVVPSCTFHLPGDTSTPWNEEEYFFTMRALLDAWNAAGHHDVMPIEKDFSPTLAGSDLALHRETILAWVARVPMLMRRAADARPVHIGMKIFNTLFDEEFQTQLLARATASGGETDFVIYGNRLFDPKKEFEGKIGVAYGGPDLSWYNLKILNRVREQFPDENRAMLPISATGNIDSGARAIEYLKLGCTTFQLHTSFQLADEHYTMKRGTKAERALHEILFHPVHGFISGVLRLREEHRWPEEWNVFQMGSFFG